ncbi:rhogap and gas domain containing protein [Dermatophagoides farinae]|uniref:Rhogap and gas domain containing protein n=1 Tax=Dermatophagoides farinae TaxID=6954 RepID=A0A9D4NSA7_DERFA|nr:rho GTPase-activating protein 45-like [Dermatophagoides farinae]KAH7636992.1 rhogap and gas domain containing protein [Dermatophagoides farinae]
MESQQQQHYSATGAGSNKNIGHYSQTLTYLLGELKHVYDQRDDPEKKRKAAYERLAEISKIMRVILEKYSLLESKELLLNASQLVKAVKTYDYNNYSIELHSQLVDNINALYKSFQYNISNCLMQDGVSMSSLKSLDLTQKIQSSPPPPQQQTSIGHPSPSASSNRSNKSRTLPINMPEERIFSYESGLDELMKQAKCWCKYMKELVTFIEKRAQIESEYNRAISKNDQNMRTTIHQLKSDKAFLPFHNVYNQFCQNEIKNANMCDNNFDLLSKNILAPVNEFRLEFDKQIKKIKDDWAKANKQLNDVISTYSKSRENFYTQKLQDAESKTKQKFSYLESSNEFNEAEANNTKFLWILNAQKESFKKSKRELISRLQNLMAITEIKIKEITSHYFETLRDSITYSPEEIHRAIIDTDHHEMGKPYRDFSNSLPLMFDDSSSSINHQSIQSTSHHHSENQELYSSESDSGMNNNSNVYLIKQQQQQKPVHIRKESKAVNAINPKTQSNDNFQIKVIEKKYKSVYQYKKGVKCNENKSGPNLLFRVPLCQLSSNAVPDVIKKCVNQIETRGSRISGIYRVSAVKSQVDSLTKAYETDPDSVDLSNVSPNVIANLLKQFFRMLPEPLLTFQLYNELIEVATRYSKNSPLDSSSEEEIVTRLRKICRRLPTIHYNTLRYLINHLRQISKDSEFNQMNPGNLGIVFGPTLLKKADNDDTNMLYDTNHQSRVIELFILYSDQVFDSDSEPDNYAGIGIGLHRNNSFGQIDNKKSYLRLWKHLIHL